MRRNKDEAADAIPEGHCQACGYRTASLAVMHCPECGGCIVPARRPKRPSKLGWLSLPPMRYPRPYAWFVVVSVLDILFTWTVLLLGGKEVNAIADMVINYAGGKGIIIYKFCLIVLVMVLCEIIGRRRDRIGKKLAEWSVALTAIPVVLSIYQLIVS